ncbi:hypothetical protein NW760_015350 [Fusarium oxysporum]|nr:hypothetical protein NW769_015345 [Fusarium oxysporum]KAJ4212451.1 hypothetical protein NW760_015350 [Fusarium oxysporum]
MGAGSMAPWMSGAQACGRRNEAMQKFQVQLRSMEQQNENELTARQGRDSLSRNDGIAGGWGGQGPLQCSKLFQRPALEASRPEPLPYTIKQVKLGIQQMNNTGLDLFQAEIDGIGNNVGVLWMNGWTRASSSHTCRQSNDQTNRQTLAAKETQFQQQEITGHNGPVQWQNDPGENRILQTTQRVAGCQPSGPM